MVTNSFNKSFLDPIQNNNKVRISPINPHIQRLFLPKLEDTTTANWKNDLPTEHLTDLMLEEYLKLQKLTVAKNWKETQFKLMHRAYSMQLYKRAHQESLQPYESKHGGNETQRKRKSKHLKIRRRP